MRDFKNIDRLFQENLKDLEVFPPNKAWSNIEKRLVRSPKRRRTPFFIKIASVAAILIFFFSIGTIYFLPENNLTKNFLPERFKSNTVKENNDSINNSNTTKNISTDKSSNSEVKLTDEKNVSIISNTTKTVAENNTEETSLKKKYSKNQYLTDAVNLPLPKSSDKEIPKKEITTNKFTVSTIFAPIYFNSSGEGSGIASQFKDSPTSGSSSFSYGVKVAYQINNKFSVQSGINLISLGYTTNNIYVTQGVAVIGLSSLSSTPNELLGSKESISSTKENTLSIQEETLGSLNQVFGYIEIPVEVKYNLADGKFGVNLVGGFSTLLLNNDEVFVETNDFSQSLGASNNLRSVNFSGNIGIDVDYLIYKNLFINISPMFKIQTNTFSKNSGSIQPYYLGVYTGLNYKF